MNGCESGDSGYWAEAGAEQRDRAGEQRGEGGEAEAEKREKDGDKAGAQTLSRARDQLLEMQREMQEATRKMLSEAQATLDEIMAADDVEEAVIANSGRIDEAFLHVLEARQLHAEQTGRRDEMEKLRRIQEFILSQMGGDTPPEVQLLTQLVSAPGKEDRERLMAAMPDLLTDQLVEIIGMLREQARNAGQNDLASRLDEVEQEVAAQLQA